jgi:putative transposase
MSVSPPKRLLASAFGIARSSLYYREKLPDKDRLLRNQIIKLHETDDTLGSRSVSALLNIGRERAARVMIKYDIQPRRRTPRYRYPGRADAVVNNKLMDSTIDLTDYEVLFSDILQFRLSDRSWVYCCFIIRKKTRQILSFCYSWGMRAELVAESLKHMRRIDTADLSSSDVIFHSDQGKQYGAGITIDAAIELHFERSMSRAGTPTDNAIAERFVGTFKHAVVQRYSFQNIGEFEEAANNWLNFYNNERPHQSLKINNKQHSPNNFAQKQGLKTIPYLTSIRHKSLLFCVSG